MFQHALKLLFLREPGSAIFRSLNTDVSSCFPFLFGALLACADVNLRYRSASLDYNEHNTSQM